MIYNLQHNPIPETSCDHMTTRRRQSIFSTIILESNWGYSHSQIYWTTKNNASFFRLMHFNVALIFNFCILSVTDSIIKDAWFRPELIWRQFYKMFGYFAENALRFFRQNKCVLIPFQERYKNVGSLICCILHCMSHANWNLCVSHVNWNLCVSHVN